MVFLTTSLVLGIVLIVLVWWVLQIIACWRLFAKAGEPGWKSIIPVYNTYVLYKIAWQPRFFWITVLLPIASVIISAVFSESDMGIMMSGMLTGFIGIAVVVLGIFFCIKLARAFGRGGAFVLGLWFLQPIFLLILGLGDSEYLGNDL